MNTPKCYLRAEQRLNAVLAAYHATGAKDRRLEKQIYDLCVYLTRPIAGTYAKTRPPHVVDDLVQDVVGDLFIYAIPKYKEGMKAWGMYIRRIVLAKLQMSKMERHTDAMDEDMEADLEWLFHDGMEYPAFHDLQRRMEQFSEYILTQLTRWFPFSPQEQWELFLRAVLLSYVTPKPPLLKLAQLIDRRRADWVRWYVHRELLRWFQLRALEAHIGCNDE